MNYDIKINGVIPVLVLDGYGGGHDDGGDFARVTMEIPIPLDGLYELAAKLIAAGNAYREKRIAEHNEEVAGTTYGVPTASGALVLRGPYVILPARKRTPEEQAADDAATAKRIASSVAASPSDGELVTACGTDAAKWTEAWRRSYRGDFSDDDVDTLRGWFANAIEHTKTLTRERIKQEEIDNQDPDWDRE